VAEGETVGREPSHGDEPHGGEPSDGAGPERTDVGQQFAQTWDILTLASALLVLTIGLVAVLVQAWPPPSPDAATVVQEHAVRVRILFWKPGMLRDVRLFLVVLASGGMGALIHVLRSVYGYVGNRRLRRSWLLMYSLEPFVGAVLALIVYFVLRGGLTTTMASSNDINPYGVAAMAALVGMFSRQTVQKLLAVFETLLAPAEKTSDPMTPRPFDPKSGGQTGGSDSNPHR
jgi:hypothetical protein